MHRHGHVGANRRARDLARRRVDARRDVDRDDRHAGAVDLLDQPRRVVTRRALHPGAEQRIDDHVRPLVDDLAPTPRRSSSPAIFPSPPFAPPPA